MKIDLVAAAKANNEATDNLIDEARQYIQSNDLIDRLVEELCRLRGGGLYSQRALLVRQAEEIEQLKEKLKKGTLSGEHTKKIKNDFKLAYNLLLQERDDLAKWGGTDIIVRSGQQVLWLNNILELMYRAYNNILEMEKQND